MIDVKLLEEVKKLGGDAPLEYEPVDRISSGSFMLDDALNGGWARGKINLIKGDAGSGKTHLGLLALISARKMGFTPVMLDAEKSFNLNYAFRAGLGKPNEDYYYIPVGVAEDAFNIIRKVSLETTGLIVVDSWAALPTRAEFEGEADDNYMAVFARKSGQFFRSVTDDLMRSNCGLLIINQTRTGFGTGFSYETIPGGNPIKFYPSVSVDVDKGVQEYLVEEKTSEDGKKSKKENKDLPPVGMTIQGSLYKNKYGPNYTSFKTEIRFYPKLFVKKLDELVELSKKYGIFRKKEGDKIKNDSAIFHYNSEEIGKGKEATKEALSKRPDLIEVIERDLREIITNRTNVIEE